MINRRPDFSWLSQRIRQNIGDVQKLAEALMQSVGEDKRLPPGLIDWRFQVCRGVGLYQHQLAPGTWRVPYLNEQACSALLARMTELKFKPNDAEDAPFQMDEAVLAREDNELFLDLLAMHNVYLRPLWVVAFGILPNDPQSIQLAKYNPGERGMTNWHFDADSECTTTVVLSPDEAYDGGGMQVWPGLDLGRGLQGVATLFQGRNLLHRSNPVTRGERSLLVHWMNHTCGA